MAMQYPNRRNFLFAFSSLTLLEGADLWNGLAAVNINPSVDGADAYYGQGTKPIGHLRGRFKAEMEIKFHGEAFFDWARKHPSFLTELFDDLVCAIEEGARREQIIIVGPRFTGGALESEGTDAMEFTLPGMALDILMGPNKTSIFEGSAEGAGSTGAGTGGEFGISADFGFEVGFG